jgi:Phosphotransferase enzyme family
MPLASLAMTRDVTLVLVDPSGSPLGSLPPFTVEVPWWPEVADVVAEARSRWDVDLAVLRVLGTPDRPGPPGGPVVYAAEVTSGAVPGELGPLPAGLDGSLASHPLRAPWAQPGGPAGTVAWARAALEAIGRPTIAVRQRKTWNLSAIWEVRTSAGSAWIKQVPDFFHHEAALLSWLGSAAPGTSTRLLADAGGRMVLDHVPGEDRFGAPVAERDAMAADLHRIQAYVVTRVDELLALGVPDRRAEAAAAGIAGVADRHGPGLPADVRTRLDALVDDLPGRFASIADCGLPDTLVHGDFHPGNVRSDGTSRVIIDWGDATVGHPAMDIARLTETLAPAEGATLVASWAKRWRGTVPGSDPERALELLRPVIAALYAVVYAGFLDRIEPSEWPYHSSDVPAYLRTAVELSGQSPQSVPPGTR